MNCDSLQTSDLSSGLSASGIPTRIFEQGEDLLEFIIEHVPRSLFLEGTVLAVTSKIVSLAENAVIPAAEVLSKDQLVRREADVYLTDSNYGTGLTIKHGILIPAAGIDESNSANGHYILFPKDPYQSAQTLHRQLKAHYGLKSFGLIITDSHTHPLRRGVTGIGLAHWGFSATRKLVGKKDLFGRPLTMTYVNTLDALSVAAVFVMGEAAESCPLAWVRSNNIDFTETTSRDEICIPLEDDLYGPLIRK